MRQHHHGRRTAKPVPVVDTIVVDPCESCGRSPWAAIGRDAAGAVRRRCFRCFAKTHTRRSQQDAA